RGLFARLANSRVRERLALVDEATRQRPARRRVLALDEHDAAFHLDDDVDRQKRCRWPVAHPLVSPAKSAFSSPPSRATSSLCEAARLCCSVGSADRSYSSVVFSLSFWINFHFPSTSARH